MAFTIANQVTLAEIFVADITASADADVGPLNVPHGMQAAPSRVTITPLLTNAYLSEWIVSAIDATNIELTKANVVGSGDADPQIRVCAELSYSPQATSPVREPELNVPEDGDVA